jgi:ATP-dependent phosphofructokinase / diphosphate-dependent phosphofructokinase
MLGTTNQGNPFAFPMPDGSLLDRSEEIIAGYHELGLEALIGIGGDGSLAILRKLAQQGGLNLVAIPKTIDNDVGITERSVGFDTAVNIATEAQSFARHDLGGDGTRRRAYCYLCGHCRRSRCNPDS